MSLHNRQSIVKGITTNSLYFQILILLLSVCCVIEFYNVSDSTQFTREEVTNVGNGIIWYNNIVKYNKNPISSPPISSILDIIALRICHFTIPPIDAITYVDYDNIIAYSYVMQLPFLIGEQFINRAHNAVKGIIRFKNIICLILIILAVIRNLSTLVIAIPLIFICMPLIVTATSEMVFIFILNLIPSIIKDLSKIKSCFIGMLLGLLITTASFNGFFIYLLSICSSIIAYDLYHQKFSKGFSINYCLNILICCSVALFVIWIIYGCNLSTIAEFISMFGIESQNSLKIVPFCDNFKSMIFEIMYEDHNMLLQDRIVLFISNVHWVIVILAICMSIFSIIKMHHNLKLLTLSVFTLLLLSSSVCYFNANLHKISNYFTTISILLHIVIVPILTSSIIHTKKH